MANKGKIISFCISCLPYLWFVWTTIVTIANAEIEPVDDTANTLPPVSKKSTKNYKKKLIKNDCRKQKF